MARIPRPTPGFAQRLPELDAMRGVAALLVLLHHMVKLIGPQNLADGAAPGRAVHILLHFSPLRVLEFGRGPVLFFFVLSGYVLTRALMHGGSPGLAAFAAQRSLRLLIPVTVSVLLSALLYALVVDPALMQGPLAPHSLTLWANPPNAAAILREVLLLQTDDDFTRLNPVLWSLVHEWRLTLLLPLVLLFRGRVWALLTLAMVATSFGAMGSAAENSVQLGEELHSSIVASIYFSASIGSGAALALIGPLPLMSGGQRIATGITAVALTGLEADLAIYAASVLLIVLAQQPGRFRDVLRSVPLVWLGRMSFSLYLIHAPIMVAWLCLTHAALPLWAIAASGGLIALALSPPFHRLVEQPSRDLARFAEKRLRRPADGEVKAYSGR